MNRPPAIRQVDNDKPLVSIITPTFNQAAFIERTILSVINQRYQNIEHLIIDAGSTDGTLDILAAYEGAYNMRWISEPDEGMYDAINKGLAMANGDIFCYVNSDDYYLPWTIERVVEAFAETPDAGLVFGDIVYFDEVTGKGCFRLLPPFWLGMLQRSGFLAQPGVFWRQIVTDAIGPFDPELKFVGDCDYWMRAGQQFRFKHVHEILAVESEHPATKHAQDPSGLWAELDAVRDRYQKPGIKRTALQVVDFLYRAILAQYNFCRFALGWASKRYGNALPSRKAWPFFITEEPFPVSPLRLLLSVLPDRKRSLGQGVVRQVSLAKPSRRKPVVEERAA